MEPIQGRQNSLSKGLPVYFMLGALDDMIASPSHVVVGQFPLIADCAPAGTGIGGGCFHLKPGGGRTIGCVIGCWCCGGPARATGGIQAGPMPLGCQAGPVGFNGPGPQLSGGHASGGRNHTGSCHGCAHVCGGASMVPPLDSRAQDSNRRESRFLSGMEIRRGGLVGAGGG